MNKYWFDNIIFNNKISFGFIGTTYNVTINTKKYAYKIEKCNIDDVHDKKSKLWDEINFSLKFANKYPDFFMYLYAYNFIDNCDYVNENDKYIAKKKYTHKGVKPTLLVKNKLLQDF